MISRVRDGVRAWVFDFTQRKQEGYICPQKCEKCREKDLRTQHRIYEKTDSKGWVAWVSQTHGWDQKVRSQIDHGNVLPSPTMSIIKRQGAYLPHWRTENATYFITFRLAGSLPKILSREREVLKQEIIECAQRNNRPLTIFELDELEELHFEETRLKPFDHDARFLENERIASIVSEVLTIFEGIRYNLFAWSIMPNHVHVVVRPFPNFTLSSIVHSWKRVSALKVNRLKKTKGSFWQEEYYDHLIRDEADLTRCIQYTFDNPEKAALKNWSWKWKCEIEESISKAFPE